MKRFILEQSDNEFYTSHSGLALICLCINCCRDLSRVTSRKMKDKANLILNSDLLRSYFGILCLGKSDCEAVVTMRKHDYFKNALGNSNVPSAERLRQRFDEEVEKYLPIVQKCSVAMLKTGKAYRRHIPLDAAVSPLTTQV